nr:transketolase [Lachnospiraceae bacterium]
MENLKAMSFDFRKDAVDMIMSGKGGHIGGDMSVMDILIELYYEQMNTTPANINDPERDRFIMSKGHSVEALYTVL